MSRISLVLLLLVPLSVGAAEPRKADVVVYGGSASGVIAAVAVGREGKTVILLEPGVHVGGMVSGGLGATDTGNRGAIGGYSREFFARVKEYYVKKYGADSQQVKDSSDGFHFEPHVAELIFKEMLKEAKVEVVFNRRLEQVSMKKTDSGMRIEGIKAGKSDDYQAAVWIDASYEGDLMAAAKIDYHVGREGKDDFKESIAGVQARSPAHQWSVKVSPFTDDKKLLPCVQSGPGGEAGKGDKKVQAYNYRLCLTQNKENQVAFPKPADYDPKRYELLARYLEAKPGLKVGQLMNPVKMPNGKTDVNNNGAFSTDHIGANWDYPDGDHPVRERIRLDHISYIQGFLYFLANDNRVPKTLQEEVRNWGLAKDEFTDTNHWPHQLYVREARRMRGEYVMTQTDILEKRIKDDSIGLGSYNTDSHHVQRIATADGAVINEGDFQVGVQPYAIPYPSLVPKSGTVGNLFVPVCMSATHVAYCTVRMEPVYMILGHASGVAAAQALDDKQDVQKISVEKLQGKLKAQKAILSPEGLSRPVGAGERWDSAKLPGIVVDNADATVNGDWNRSTSASPYVNDGYLHDDNLDKGKKTVRFVPKVPSAGKYDVFIVYSPNPNRATNVPVVVHHAGGETTVKVNQRAALKDNKPLKLGTFEFKEGKDGWIEIRTTDTDGHVIADAVQLVTAK